jgi:hypothetical protein
MKHNGANMTTGSLDAGGIRDTFNRIAQSESALMGRPYGSDGYPVPQGVRLTLPDGTYMNITLMTRRLGSTGHGYTVNLNGFTPDGRHLHAKTTHRNFTTLDRAVGWVTATVQAGEARGATVIPWRRV